MRHRSLAPMPKWQSKKRLPTPSDEESSESPPRASMKEPAASGSSSGGGKKKPTLRRAEAITTRPAASGETMLVNARYGPDPRPESWFDGSKCSEAVAEAEMCSLSIGLLLELGICIHRRNVPDEPPKYAGSVCGVLSEMVQRDRLGMEIIMKDPIGSTPDLNKLICSLMVNNVRHMRFHMCLKRQAMVSQVKLCPHPSGHVATPPGWIHANFWRVRVIEDITEELLKGLFCFERLAYEDDVM